MAEEVLSSIRTVVAFGGEQKETERYDVIVVAFGGEQKETERYDVIVVAFGGEQKETERYDVIDQRLSED